MIDQKPVPAPADSARFIIRSSLKAALATIEKSSGNPYASLVTVATDSDGSPLLLISALAVHTKNLQADPRASLLFDASDGAGDPLAGGRVTVIGPFQPVAEADIERLRQRFLARQPAAQMYAGFADFRFWRQSVERAHYIGGFGRIVDLPSSAILEQVDDAQELVAAEPGIVTHMNTDHADAVQLYATRLLGAGAGPWQMTGIDPAGIDLSNGERGLRVAFEARVTNAGAAREQLVLLTRRARETAA